MKTWIIGLVCAVALSIGLASCGGGARTRTVTIKGSDTMVILGQRWAETYMHHNPGVTVQVTGGGSGTGIAALTNGGTDICTASRPMSDKERQKIHSTRNKEVQEIPVALDGVTVFINKENPVQQLDLEQLRKIYRGEITDWKDVGGTPGKIVCYGRENNSGTYAYLKEHVLKDKDFANDVQPLPGTAAVINAVLKDKAGIGYGGIGYAAGVRLVPLSVKPGDKAVTPNMATVVSGDYPLARKLFFYTAGQAEGEVKTFIDWTLSEEGQKVCEKADYFPVRQK